MHFQLCIEIIGRRLMFFSLISTVFYRSSNTLHDLRGIPLQKQDKTIQLYEAKNLCQQIKKNQKREKYNQSLSCLWTIRVKKSYLRPHEELRSLFIWDCSTPLFRLKASLIQETVFRTSWSLVRAFCQRRKIPWFISIHKLYTVAG